MQHKYISRWPATPCLGHRGYRVGQYHVERCGAIGYFLELHEGVHALLGALLRDIFLFEEMSAGAVVVGEEIGLSEVGVVVGGGRCILGECLFEFL